MNIFVTDVSPVQSAINLPDIHIRKMIVETAQLLSTAHFELDGTQLAYKPTHKNHPSAKWVRESSANYIWALEHLEALCAEYTHRFGKVHKTELVALPKLRKLPTNICHTTDIQAFAMAMPDDFKIKGIRDQTIAYKLYLTQKFTSWATRTDQRPIIAKWTNRSAPAWYTAVSQHYIEV